MKRLLLAIALLFPTAAYAQGTFRGADELRRHQAIESAETDRQEKWMIVLVVLVAAGVGIYFWNDYQKRQRK